MLHDVQNFNKYRYYYCTDNTNYMIGCVNLHLFDKPHYYTYGQLMYDDLIM